jgi:hypothetical protein
VTGSVIGFGCLQLHIRFAAQVSREPLGGFFRRGGELIMGRALTCLATILCVLDLTGCGDIHWIDPPGGNSRLVFVDKGAVVPEPVETSVAVDPERISGTSTQNGVVFGTWSTKLDGSDYEHLLRIATDSMLFRGPEPQFGSGLCVGARDLVVYITINGLADTIIVPGGKRCKNIEWPAGLRSLVAFKDSLITKYHQ